MVAPKQQEAEQVEAQSNTAVCDCVTQASSKSIPYTPEWPVSNMQHTEGGCA
jgi:hypothetical protein